jgi:hypothetical protein
MNFLRGTIVTGAGGTSAMALEAAGGRRFPSRCRTRLPPERFVAGVRPEHVVSAAERWRRRHAGHDGGARRAACATTFAYCVLANGERLTVQSAGQARHAPGEALPRRGAARAPARFRTPTTVVSVARASMKPLAKAAIRGTRHGPTSASISTMDGSAACTCCTRISGAWFCCATMR